MSQNDVARGLGISCSNYQYYERGQREPKLTTFVKFCDFYEVSTDYLTGRSDTPYSK